MQGESEERSLCGFIDVTEASDLLMIRLIARVRSNLFDRERLAIHAAPMNGIGSKKGVS